MMAFLLSGLLGVASAATIRVCPAEDLGSAGCVGLQQAVEDASRVEQTTLELEAGVYRGPVRVEDGRDIILLALGDVTFAASASDPRMDGFVAQIEVLDGAISVVGLTLAPVNLGALYVGPGMSGVVEGVSVAPSGSGWGVWAQSSDVVVRDALFVGGLAFDGAHLLANGSTVRLESSELLGGVAVNSGGSVAVGADSVLDVVDCRFADNRADQGGAISAGDATVTILGGLFESNRADIDGGAIQSIGGVLTVDRGDFRENTAENGGAVSVRSGEVALRVSSFCKNAAEITGGAVDTGTAVTASITNARFLDNGATQGGALAIRAPGVGIAHASFLGNLATIEGSALWVTAEADASLQNALLAYSIGALAATVSPDSSLTVDNAVLFQNELGDLSLDVVSSGLVREDPLLRGYQPGQACGLTNDFHRPDSPLVVEQPTDDPIPDLDACVAPAREDDETLVDVFPDWGAYGGPCGFPSLAWADADGDFVPALYDCNDGDATINPNAEERWYDGIDQDCSGGSDFDQDGDGDPVGSDCDDTDETRAGSFQDLNPFIDIDCDGQSENFALEYRRARVRCATGPTPSGVLLGGLWICLVGLRARHTSR
jgi:predicted outer membrane repeat protein